MSLINKIKRVFTRIDSDSQDDELLIDSTETDDYSDEVVVDNDSICIEEDREGNHDSQKMAAIFDKVISVFNESLPDFLKSSIDSEKQKQYLMSSLETSLKDYLHSVEEEAVNRGMALYQNERNEQKKLIENLKQRMLEVEKKRNDLNEQHLSDGRQKRALNERVRDLEKQIIELEADREQLDIENKSLVNKIKVASVMEADVEAMRQELNTLRASQSDNSSDEEVSRLKEENTKLSADITYLKSEIDGLNEELSKCNEALQAVKMKDEMNDAMLNDLQKRASEANKNLKDAENKIADLTEDIAVKIAQIDDYKKMSDEKDSQMAEVLEKLAEKDAMLAESDAKLAEAEENMDAISEIAEQIEAFSDVKRRLEDRISRLKEEVTNLKSENSSLRDTIQRNLFTEAQHNKSYQEEIDKLREDHDNNYLCQ